MLLQIGTRREADPDVVDLLLECHARIRGHLALAVRLGRADPAGADAQAAAAQIHRYFTEALPLHIADEDELIAPRIAGTSDEVDRALATMHREHVEHAPDLACLAELPALAADLQRRMLAHLELEERVLFPAIRTLPAAERRAIVDAMRARRVQRA